MTYHEEIRTLCINALKKCRMQYTSLKYILDRGWHKNPDDPTYMDKVNQCVYEATIFLEQFPTNTPCELMTIKEFEETFDAIQEYISCLDHHFDMIHNREWITHTYETDIMSRYGKIVIDGSYYGTVAFPSTTTQQKPNKNKRLYNFKNWKVKKSK
jgi:hypothetical protein